MARETTEARRARTERDHARQVAGDMLLSCFPEGWTSVDFAALKYVIERNGNLFRKMSGEPLEVEEAAERLRRWERKGVWEPKK